MPAPTTTADPVVERIRASAQQLTDPSDIDFSAAFDKFANVKVVLLGEASHGTSEFYHSRAAITRRLIERHGFNIVAVEADWPDAASVDRDVRHKPPPRAAVDPPFTRFPTWMWRNTDVESFVTWLRKRNALLPSKDRAGFFGLDLYSLNSSMRAVIDYLDHIDPETAKLVRKKYACLSPWADDPPGYGAAALTKGYAPCEKSVIAVQKDLLAKRLAEYEQVSSDDDLLDVVQNAQIVTDAEKYYRAMYYGSEESWNLRDTHMFRTLDLLLRAKGPDSKAVVWAHNSHIGDARATGMGMTRGEINIGQLCRERYGAENVSLIGFGTHTGTVAAAAEWDEPMEVKRVNPSLDGSYERLAHETGLDRFLLDLRRGSPKTNALRQALMRPRLERFIGVIYRPNTERWSHYSKAVLPEQFDAYVWFDETTAVTPLPTKQTEGMEETYPFGL